MPMSRPFLTALTALSVTTAACSGASSVTTATFPEIPDSLPAPTGTVIAPAIGVAPPTACVLATGPGRGAEVLAVADGSPADGALDPGDVIVAVDGATTATATDVITRLRQRGAGEDAVLAVVRRAGGDDATVRIRLEESPEFPDRPIIGATIRTVVDEAAPGDLPPNDGDDGPGTRVVAVDGDLFVLDAAARWERLGTAEPEGTGGWIAHRGEVLALEPAGPEPGALLGILSGSRVELATDDWLARRVLGMFGERVLVAAQRPVEAAAGLEDDLEEGLVAVDAATGRIAWVWEPVRPDLDPQLDMPVPIETFVRPGGESVVVVIFFPTIGAVASLILDEEGNELTSWPPPQPGFLPNGAFPRGWFDATRLLYVGPTEEGNVHLWDAETATAEQIEFDLTGLDGVWPVGDGRSVLTRDTDAVRLVDVAGEMEPALLARDCDVGQPAPPGWVETTAGSDS